MKCLRIFLILGVSLATTGCFNLAIPKKFDVNVNTGGKDDDGKDGDDGSGKPTQLPDINLGSGDWKDIAWSVGGSIVGAENGFLYYAYDSLAYPNHPVDLAVRLKAIKGYKPVRGATVEFYWKDELIEAAKTDADGLAKIAWTPPRPGIYKFAAKVAAVEDDAQGGALKIAPAPLLVAAHDRSTPFVVIDLDHTVVDSSFFRVLLQGTGRPM
ncbi:MAG TPA: hypothetical protein VMZ50_05275, partial [Phycisphaerae bacterium]|nr:hypothetical protein [Phycisphaerae bacterium]